MHIAQFCGNAPWVLHMGKESPPRDIKRRNREGRKMDHDYSSIVGAVITKPIPSEARVLFVGLACTALESAISDDREAVLLGFSLLRETFRELEAIFEQMSGSSAVNKRSLRKGPAKVSTTRTQQSRATKSRR
jgi:hypothetical protein